MESAHALGNRLADEIVLRSPAGRFGCVRNEANIDPSVTARLLDDDLRSDAYTLVEVLDVFVEHPDTAVRNKMPD